MESSKILKELQHETKKRKKHKEEEKRKRDNAAQKKKKRKKTKVQAEKKMKSFASFCNGMASEDKKCRDTTIPNKQAPGGKSNMGTNGKKKGKWFSYTSTSHLAYFISGVGLCTLAKVTWLWLCRIVYFSYTVVLG